MAVTLHSPAGGKQPGETYEGPDEAWLVANGYASDGSEEDKHLVAGVDADQDPTLAANRENAGEPTRTHARPNGPVEELTQKKHRKPKETATTTVVATGTGPEPADAPGEPSVGPSPTEPGKG